MRRALIITSYTSAVVVFTFTVFTLVIHTTICNPRRIHMIGALTIIADHQWLDDIHVAMYHKCIFMRWTTRAVHPIESVGPGATMCVSTSARIFHKCLSNPGDIVFGNVIFHLCFVLLLLFVLFVVCFVVVVVKKQYRWNQI